jgi:transcriptional regulator with XRE-family HTH domain
MDDAARAAAQPPPDDDEDAKRWREFGVWLEQTYLAKGMTRRDLERASGVQYSTLQRLEDGGRREGGEWKLPNPSDATLQKLARFLHVPAEELYERAGGRARDRNQGRKIARPRRQAELEERLDQVEAQLAEVLERLGADARPPRRRRRDQEAG